MITSRRTFLALGLATPALAACSSVLGLPGQTPGPEVYRLSGALPARARQAGSPLGAQMVVMEFSAPRELDTDRIAVAPGPRRLDHYANGRWSDRTPAMVQDLLVASLDATGRFKALAKPGGFLAEVALAGDIDHFEAQTGSTNKVVIALRLRLLAEPLGHVLEATNLEREAPVEGAGLGAVVAAFEAAMTPILVEAQTWVVAKLEALKA